MKHARILKYKMRKFALGTDPEAVLFVVAIIIFIIGLVIRGTNPFLLIGGLLILVYGVVIALWLRDKLS